MNFMSSNTESNTATRIQGATSGTQNNASNLASEIHELRSAQAKQLQISK
jgi:hypothetical protein